MYFLKLFCSTTVWLAFLLLALVYCASAQGEDFALTAAESQWLKEHPVIRVAPDPDFPPYEWLSDDGAYHGIGADYISLIENKLGIKFEIIPSASWTEIIEHLKQKKVDIQPAFARTRQRQKYMLFTQPYTSVPGVVVSSRRYPTIEELRGRQVAVVQGSYWDDGLSNANPDVNVEYVDNTRFGIKSSAMGTVDAMITDLASATSEIRKAGITNLHIVSDPKHNLGRLEHSIAVRNDWPELQMILDKVLSSISQEEHEAILSNWIKIEEPAFWRDRDFWYSLLAGMAVILLLFASFITWNRTLKKQVILRTSELQTAQMKLMQAEKMESIGRLAAGVAHEVKNPLAIIQMGADYLAQEMRHDTTAIEVIKDIEDAVHRADKVIYGLLDFSRDKKLELKPGNINEVITSALHLVDHELRQRNIKVQLNLAESLPVMALDGNKLQQVFINLFMNAAHAMEHNGELQITSSESSAALIRVQVADNGPGIRTQDKAKIFELFYTTKAVGEGTGLGLSVARNIINLHHGTIDIDNRPQGGASVVLLFNLNERGKQ